MTTERDMRALDATYEAPAEKIEQFRRDGHVRLDGLATAGEAAGIRQAVLETTEQVIKAAPSLEERDTYGKAFLKNMNIWTMNETMRRIVCAKRFARVAAELLGVEGVRIYHDQALFKEAGGGYTPWHQDQYYWPLDTDNTVTMWMPLVDLSSNMGILKFASGSHTDGYLGTLPISDESEKAFEQFIRDKNFTVDGPESMVAGDATFHYGWTLHAAGGNDSDMTREVMTIIWVADGCHVTEPVNPNQERDITRWMPGLKPGDRVNSRLNPLVYP